MLSGSMQDAIKARAAGRVKKEFKDPYVKPKMSKEDFLAEKSRGAKVSSGPIGTGTGTSIDLSPLLTGQAQMQRQLQQLAEQMKQLSSSSSSSAGVPAVLSDNHGTSNWTADLDKLKRELRASQRQATNDILSQVECLVRDAVSSQLQASGSSSSSSLSKLSNDDTQVVARLQREVAQLKREVVDLQQEKEALRQKCEVVENKSLLADQKAAAAATTTAAACPAAKGPSATHSTTNTRSRSSSSSNNSSEMQVTETSKAYQLALDLQGVKISDLNISYGSGALELAVKDNKTYTFQVAASLIDASGIGATLQPNGGLQITVPKKK